MREVNFSIPSANKASVGITPALYDRRALDCTSTLPLINSLNHLTYLTTSSARIRDILTVDGGVERLVNIIKDGRSKDFMEMWKWNLAFQCVVNIGVRGSEAVRTRVVEADMVPVIATILDNHIIVDKCREKAEAEMKRTSAQIGTATRHRHRSGDILGSSNGHRTERGRRHPPPPIDIPTGFTQQNADSQLATTTPLPGFSFSSPPERTTFRRPQHHPTRSREGRPPLFTAASTAGRQQGVQPFGGTGNLGGDGQEIFGIRPVRDADRLPSMLPTLQAEITSQPQSPMTPSGAMPARPISPRRLTDTTRPRRRTTHGPQISSSGDSDDNQQEEVVSDASADPAPAPEPIVGLQNDINIPNMIDNDGMLEDGAPVGLNAPPSDDADVETFNITHRSTIDGSIVTPIPPPAPGPITLSPIVPNVTPEATAANPIQANAHLFPRYVQERNSGISMLPAMPRDEDALMSLQLLAYVSKYCNLRSFFQKSHLVPKLKIGSDLQLLDGEIPKKEQQMDLDLDDEFLLPNDFNIFPLVEKFTVRHHSQDMQYWAGVVMRNLCRKDDSRGGIRQCAYYQCGRWEEYTRQFAKCRRCRRTKYCSKECQKSAWVYHRHWCEAAQQ